MDTAALEARLDAAYPDFLADPQTSSGSVAVTGSAPTVTGVGTGVCAHLSGVFQPTVTVDEVDSVPCDGTGALLKQTIIISAGTSQCSDVGRPAPANDLRP